MTAEFHNPFPDRLLSAKTVRRLLDVSDRGLRRWVSGGKFPPADVQIGRTLRWRESTVRGFIEAVTNHKEGRE